MHCGVLRCSMTDLIRTSATEKKSLHLWNRITPPCRAHLQMRLRLMSIERLTMDGTESVPNKGQLSWLLRKWPTPRFHLRQPLVGKVFPNVTELQSWPLPECDFLRPQQTELKGTSYMSQKFFSTGKPDYHLEKCFSLSSSMLSSKCNRKCPKEVTGSSYCDASHANRWTYRQWRIEPQWESSFQYAQTPSLWSIW